jgi:hypothetical protein
MRKVIFLVSLVPITIVSVGLGIELTGLVDPTHIKENVPLLIGLTSVLFGALGAACFRLLRLRLVQSNGKILIVGPREKVEGTPGPASESNNRSEPSASSH